MIQELDRQPESARVAGTLSAVYLSECPDGDTMERYLLDQLPEKDALSFEAHYLTCCQCLEQLSQTGDYVNAIKAVAGRS